jgi:nucleotide-binding universal stress UspA family protein
MFRKILVCIDIFSPDENLISCTASLKNLGAEEVVLAHVIYVANTPGLDGMLTAQARPEMDRWKKILEDAGLAVAIEMPLGLPDHALNDLAEANDVSLIVIGTHGRGLAESIVLGGVALGNVSAKLLHITRRPVLLVPSTIPGEEAAKECLDLFAHILFPTDFSDTAEIAFAYLETVVRSMKCPVTLLHVQDQVRPAPYLSHRLKELQDLDMVRLQRLKTWLKGLGASQVSIELAQGKPGDEVLEYAKAKDCSLILMGTQGKGITREILLGSVAHQVARHAGQPILFIPALQ